MQDDIAARWRTESSDMVALLLEAREDARRLHDIAKGAVSDDSSPLGVLGDKATECLPLRLLLKDEEQAVLAALIPSLPVEQIPIARLLHQLNQPGVAHVPLVIGIRSRLTDLWVQRLVGQVQDKVPVDFDDPQPLL